MLNVFEFLLVKDVPDCKLLSIDVQSSLKQVYHSLIPMVFITLFITRSSSYFFSYSRLRITRLQTKHNAYSLISLLWHLSLKTRMQQRREHVWISRLVISNCNKQGSHKKNHTYSLQNKVMCSASPHPIVRLIGGKKFLLIRPCILL